MSDAPTLSDIDYRDAAGFRLPSPVEVSRRLLYLGALFDEAEKVLRARDEEWVRAKQRHEVAYARAFLGSLESSDGKRKADAMKACADLRLEMEIAEMVLRGVRERIKTLDRQMEIARSVGATSRAEMSANGWTP